jgi:hypothetical protein
MDVNELPFNRLIGVEPAAAGSGFLVSLPAGPQYANHLGTVHAVALSARQRAWARGTYGPPTPALQPTEPAPADSLGQRSFSRPGD